MPTRHAFLVRKLKTSLPGYSCHKLHFTPTAEDDAREDNMHDCFGRERSGAVLLLLLLAAAEMAMAVLVLVLAIRRGFQFTRESSSPRA